MFNKSRIPLLYIFLSLSLLALGCSSSPSGVTENENNNGNNSNNGDDTEEVTEPTLSIGDLADGAEASGELVFTINGEAGEAGEGFDELRILLDEEEIASASDPAMPYEQTLQTFAYDNGDYELTVELDVAGGDSTLSETVAVHFENYLMRINVNEDMQEGIANTTGFKLYISDPDGNILKSTDLSGASGTVGLLPPKSVEGKILEYFNVTITEEYEEAYSNTISTYTGLTPWETEWTRPSAWSSSDGPFDLKDLRVEIANPDVTPYTWGAISGWSTYVGTQVQDGLYSLTLPVLSDANNLISFVAPDPQSEDNVFRYHWKKDIQELSDGDTVQYDAAEDFEKMVSHDIAHSQDLRLASYTTLMSTETDSWSAGRLLIPLFSLPQDYDQNPSESVYGLMVPETDHMFDTSLLMVNKSNTMIEYMQQTIGGLPDDFYTVDADADQSGLRDFSNVTLDYTGTENFDYVHLYVGKANYYQEDRWSWDVYLPASQESFTPPKISDEINWDTFNVQAVELVDTEGFDSYEDYMNYNWTESDLAVTGYYSKTINLSIQEKRKAGDPGNIEEPKHLTIEERLRPLGNPQEK